ncbi:hypothetical protein CBL_07587 [Carabus blaptoides fortunei]
MAMRTHAPDDYYRLAQGGPAQQGARGQCSPHYKRRVRPGIKFGRAVTSLYSVIHTACGIAHGELKSLLLKIAANNINCQLDRRTGRVSLLSNVPPGLSTLARSTGKHRSTYLVHIGRAHGWDARLHCLKPRTQPSVQCSSGGRDRRLPAEGHGTAGGQHAFNSGRLCSLAFPVLVSAGHQHNSWCVYVTVCGLFHSPCLVFCQFHNRLTVPGARPNARTASRRLEAYHLHSRVVVIIIERRFLECRKR